MTSDDLIKSVKRRANIPVNQITFQDEDFLAFADEEMAMGLVPGVLRQHEDYLLYTQQIPLVNTSTRYQIPYRAVGNRLREVAFKDTNGNIYEMTRIMKEDLPFYNGPVTQSRVYAFYIENNEICLVPENLRVESGTLQTSYYIRPNSLVKLNKVSVITNIDLNTGDISVSAIPSEFSTTKLFDFIQVRSPHKSLSFDVSVTAVNGTTNTITFNPADIPANLLIGDHIALATQSAIPQVPSDVHVVLAHRVATRCLEAMGDMEGLQAANTKLAELEKQIETVITDRVEGAPKIISNRHSILRSGIWSRRYRYRGG